MDIRYARIAKVVSSAALDAAEATKKSNIVPAIDFETLDEAALYKYCLVAIKQFIKATK